MSDNNYEKKPELLTRACKRVKDLLTNIKFVRALPTITLAAMIPLAVSACNTKPNEQPGPGDSGSSTTQPGTTPGTTPGTDPGTTTSKTYSGIVNDVLNDRTISSLIDNAKTNDALYETAYFDPHPYAFLQKQGHNVSAIKSGDLSCSTTTYTIESEPNNLYMMTYAENVGSPNYYTEYLLKYTLTDKEMEDYAYLHNNDYIQAIFLNDKISASRNAEILSTAKMSVKAHEGIKSFATNNSTLKDVLDTRSVDFVLKDFYAALGRLTITAISKTDYSNTLKSSDGKVVTCFINPSGQAVVNGDIYIEPYSIVSLLSKRNELNLNMQKTKTYNIQNVNLLNNVKTEL